MTDRSYRVRLDAAVSGFVAGFKQAEQSVDQFIKKTDGASQHIDKLGSGATKLGIVAAAGLGAAAKAAIDWESDWAGVTKTVDGSTTQMAALETQLRGMAKTLPSTHHEIAAVAEAAGQLGVKRDDIASFTKVMIDLGQTTNLSADEASTSLAQFMNVMGTAPQDVGRLGASIVALGNDGASTEKDIVEMAQRISGSGKIIGLSETQVLGYAAALANVGIEAEAGGSAISMIFTKIDKAVSEGGDGLTDFATVSGLTADQFKQKFETDASGATQAFIEGLGQINAAGGDVNGTLETLGITEIRQRDAVLRLAASGTNLADSLKVSGDGWRENTALVDEAAKRYATTESQIKVAWNNIKDDAISAGAEMLPIIADIAKKAADVASAFGNLPAPVKSSAVALLGIVAAGGLMVGAVAKIVTSVAGAKTAMTALGVTTGRTGVALGALSKAGAVGAAVVGLLALTDAMDKAFGNVPTGDLSQLATDLDTFGKTSVASGALADRFGASLDGVSRRGPDLKGLGETFKAALNVDIPQLDGNAKSVKAIDEALASLVSSGNVDGAAAAFDQITAAAARQGLSVEDVQSLLPDYISNLGTAQASAEAAGEGGEKGAAGTDAFAKALDDAAKAAQKAKDDLAAYISELFQMPNQILSVRDAQRGLQAAMDDATASVKENGKTLDNHTPKGRANQAALDGIAASAIKLGEEYINSSASQKTMDAGMAEARASMVKTGVAMGMTKTAAKAYADEVIKTPTKVATDFTNNAAPEQAPSKNAAAYAAILRGTLNAVPTSFINNAGQAPKTAAEVYGEILRGTLPVVKTAVTNTAPAAKTDVDKYLDVLGLTPPAKSTNVSTPGAVGAAGSVENLLNLLGALPASKSVTINTYKNQLETVTYKTVGVKVPQADGGYWPSGIPSYANGKLPKQAMIAAGQGGGLVQWAEQETGGEAFIPLAPDKRARSTAILAQVAQSFGLDLVRSFADGGFLPGGKLVDIAFLLRQMGIPFNPTGGANFSGTLAAQTKANSAAAPAKTAANAAAKAEADAKKQVAAIQRAITLQQRHVAELRRSGASEATINAEQAKTIALQDRLFAAKKRVTAATAASNKADAVYKLRLDAAKKATDAHRESIEKLIEQQKAAVELASQVADGLTSAANIGDLFQQSLTGKGLLADLQGEGADLKAFGGQIAALRKRGLSQDLIDQIIGKGAEDGGQIAQAILDGGQGLVTALNKAQKALEDQANLIGAGAAASKFGVKVAGARAAGGPVQQGLTYQVNEKGQEFFTAPIDGYVVPHAVDPNRYQRGGGYSGGGGTTTVVRDVQHHHHNTFNGIDMNAADMIAQKAQALAEFKARSF